MYSKYKYEKLVKKYAQSFQILLGIKKEVKIHVVRSTSKKIAKDRVTSGKEYGITLCDTDGNAEVLLFYDKQPSEKEAIATLIHELFHVRLFRLTGLITLKHRKGYIEEEKLVRNLETFFMSVWWDKVI